MTLHHEDPVIAMTLNAEKQRQLHSIELIPSENYVSGAVLEALGSVFTNKYSEGYPGKRYYGGQQNTDIIEIKAIQRACELFHCRYANVQPLSGAMANIGVYLGVLQPGDTILGMDLSHGGHLTHGHPVTHMTKIFNFIRYKMKDIETGEIDYDALEATAMREKPKLILVGFSAYTRTPDFARVVEIAKKCGAMTMADMAHVAGLIAGDAYVNPLDIGFDIMTMTTHKTLRGPRGGMILTNNQELAKKIDKSIFPGLQGGPHMHVIAAKAVAFQEAKQPAFKKYAKNILLNAKAVESVFISRGLSLVAGGTDNHMLLVNTLKSPTIKKTGKEAEELLDAQGITVNKNAVPDDERGPLDPSGIRLGTPAITTRGFTELATKELAHYLVDILEGQDRSEEIQSLAAQFSIPVTLV